MKHFYFPLVILSEDRVQYSQFYVVYIKVTVYVYCLNCLI